jgi:hypothetical protein
MEDDFSGKCTDVAKHIQTSCLQLQLMATRAGLPMLAALLGMAALQAAQSTSGEVRMDDGQSIDQ